LKSIHPTVEKLSVTPGHLLCAQRLRFKKGKKLPRSLGARAKGERERRSFFIIQAETEGSQKLTPGSKINRETTPFHLIKKGPAKKQKTTHFTGWRCLIAACCILYTKSRYVSINIIIHLPVEVKNILDFCDK